MVKKSDQVRKFVADKNYKDALKIVKGFRLGISKEEIGVITRGYECIVHPAFYKQIGTDIDKTIQNAIDILTKYYG